LVRPTLGNLTTVYPTLEAPGFKLQSISCSTLVHFFENTVS
jgi:hypothetical protein